MNKEEFTYLLQHPQGITLSQTDQLINLAKKFVYFQPLRALMLKGLKLKKSYKYNQSLKVTAAYTTDRSVLFDYITSESFNQNEISNQIKQNLEHIKRIKVHSANDISIDKTVQIDDNLKQNINATEGILDPNLFETKTKSFLNSKTQTNVTANNIENIETTEEKLNIGKPLEFNKQENYSFSEWLKITSITPISRDKEENRLITPEEHKPVKPLDEKLKLIDKFISENPKIKPVDKNASKTKLVSIAADGSDNLMTETLARIYLEQKNYEKAIQSYKILSLKYPEKNSFFADQIKLIKELKDNNSI